jgi:hypothetical protein
MTTRRPSAFIQREVEGAGSGSSMVLLMMLFSTGET